MKNIKKTVAIVIATVFVFAISAMSIFAADTQSGSTSTYEWQAKSLYFSNTNPKKAQSVTTMESYNGNTVYVSNQCIVVYNDSSYAMNYGNGNTGSTTSAASSSVTISDPSSVDYISGDHHLTYNGVYIGTVNTDIQF